MAKLYLPGHTLAGAGWPHDDGGQRCAATDDPGRGRCSCGVLGPAATSWSARRSWHQKHKRQIASALGDALTICNVDGCDDPVKARRLCTKHLHRLRRHGDPTAGRTPDGSRPAFLASVIDGTALAESNGCILWPYGTSSGYPIIDHPGTGKPVRAGVLILEHFEGPRPSKRHTVGHAAHEVCGHTTCIAPDHLSWQTWEEQSAQQKRDGTFSPPPVKRARAHAS